MTSWIQKDVGIVTVGETKTKSQKIRSLRVTVHLCLLNLRNGNVMVWMMTNYKESPVFDDDQYEDIIEEEGFVDNYPNFQKDETNVSFSSVVLGVEEESMPVYDTDIEDVIEDEEGFVGKRGFDEEENNMEDVVVVANDLCSSKIQIVSVDFSKTLDSNPNELILLQKGHLVEVGILICKKYQEYLKVVPMDDKFGFKLIKVRGRVIIKKGILMQGIQIWMIQVQGTSEANSRTSFFK
ncbi:hypothetical protein Tco_1512496 [Tanacetum coccineum]